LVMDVNARSMLVSTQVAARAMIDQGPNDRGVAGKIVNMSSMGAKKGGANQAHYAASKSAVSSLTPVAEEPPAVDETPAAPEDAPAASDEEAPAAADDTPVDETPAAGEDAAVEDPTADE
ncbi:SDR family oxidoreductase, partial [Desertimonas flava]|uniref:SDR family oxidoreductase n=1 Tax=Desertimonas flava TaxID=2064846 RepID=UPI0023F17C8B